VSDVAVSHLTWTPTRRRAPVLEDVSLDLAAGERVLLAGASGAGKSTLLRAIAGVLLSAEHGTVSGSVAVAGRPAGSEPGRTALLLQEPSAAVVAETVGRDVAFGLENRGVPRSEIWPAVSRALDEAGFPYGIDRRTSALSGGELQRLALAGCVALEPSVLLLDEPTSMLDPVAAAQVRRSVQTVTARGGATLVVVEHRLEPWLDFVDRVVVLDAGRVIADGPPADVLTAQRDLLVAAGVWAPGTAEPIPTPLDAAAVCPARALEGVVVASRALGVSLAAGLVDRGARHAALTDVDSAVAAGRALAVTGPSGSGKSTLLGALGGVLRPSAGRVEAARELATRRGRSPWRWTSRDLAGRISWAPQTPEQAVVATTVRDEVRAAGRAIGVDDARLDRRADALLAHFGLEHLAAASPFHLSGGEQRRLMVAAALAHGPSAVLLDEPTVGQDRHTWQAVVGAVRAARDAGAAVALSTHDDLAVTALGADEVVLADGVRVR
jgi:energy-coupling factor transporter ATP-binding protein EcfA2